MLSKASCDCPSAIACKLARALGGRSGGWIDPRVVFKMPAIAFFGGPDIADWHCPSLETSPAFFAITIAAVRATKGGSSDTTGGTQDRWSMANLTAAMPSGPVELKAFYPETVLKQSATVPAAAIGGRAMTDASMMNDTAKRPIPLLRGNRVFSMCPSPLIRCGIISAVAEMPLMLRTTRPSLTLD